MCPKCKGIYERSKEEANFVMSEIRKQESERMIEMEMQKPPISCARTPSRAPGL